MHKIRMNGAARSDGNHAATEVTSVPGTAADHVRQFRSSTDRIMTSWSSPYHTFFSYHFHFYFHFKVMPTHGYTDKELSSRERVTRKD